MRKGMSIYLRFDIPEDDILEAKSISLFYVSGVQILMVTGHKWNSKGIDWRMQQKVILSAPSFTCNSWSWKLSIRNFHIVETTSQSWIVAFILSDGPTTQKREGTNVMFPQDWRIFCCVPSKEERGCNLSLPNGKTNLKFQQTEAYFLIFLESREWNCDRGGTVGFCFLLCF